MATVCAGSMALMDAGIKLRSTVAGIAMGLISDGKGRYAILSDILGDEEHLGDMDYKVAGTHKGITATQMDLKVTGLPYEVMAQALEQARQGRLHIIGEMEKTISQARDDFKPHAPRIIEFTIETDQIGAVIGPGGKIIQEIQRESGATITIEEKNNKGYVQIAAVGKESMDKALERVKAIVAVPEIGTIYKGKVKNITTFGAFVEILPGKDGLLHISEISHERLPSMDGVFKEGDLVEVKLIGVEDKSGKLKLSRKVLLPKPERAAHADGGSKPHDGKHRERKMPKENQNS